MRLSISFIVMLGVSILGAASSLYFAQTGDDSQTFTILAYCASVCASWIVYSVTRSSRGALIVAKAEEGPKRINTWLSIGDDKLVLCVSLIGAVLFLYFLSDVIGGYDLSELSVFSESYRNGNYKGSGLYTVLIAKAVPLLLAVKIYYRSGFGAASYVSLFLSVAAILILGLRILLLFPILAFVFSRRSFSPAFLCVLALFVVSLGLYKSFIDYGAGHTRSLTEYLLNPLVRINVYGMLSGTPHSDPSTMKCLVPGLYKVFEFCDHENLKKILYYYHGGMHIWHPNLGSYSGLATPLPVYIYNLAGPLWLFVSLYLVWIIIDTLQVISLSGSAAPFVRVMSLIAILHLSAAVFEDVINLRSFETSIIVFAMLAVAWRFAKPLFKRS